jgi:hypothetical protein
MPKHIESQRSVELNIIPSVALLNYLEEHPMAVVTHHLIWKRIIKVRPGIEVIDPVPRIWSCFPFLFWHGQQYFINCIWVLIIVIDDNVVVKVLRYEVFVRFEYLFYAKRLIHRVLKNINKQNSHVVINNTARNLSMGRANLMMIHTNTNKHKNAITILQSIDSTQLLKSTMTLREGQRSLKHLYLILAFLDISYQLTGLLIDIIYMIRGIPIGCLL